MQLDQTHMQKLVSYKSGLDFDMCWAILLKITIIEMDTCVSINTRTHCNLKCTQETVKIKGPFPRWAIKLRFLTTSYSCLDEQC